MRLIADNTALLKCVPNVLRPAGGEATLFDKVEQNLALSEEWVRTTFTSDKTFNTIAGYTAENPVRIVACRLVVSEALRTAIPSLDIVFTPNGFAVVGTQTLTPASKPRVDRLVGSMLTLRDECIAKFLPQLVGASQWLKSEQAAFFSATLFPNLAVVEQLPASQGSKWERYLDLREQIVSVEGTLAEEYFSQELLSSLRQKNLAGTLSQDQAFVVRALKAQIVDYLRGGRIDHSRMTDCVDYIRKRPDSFPEWHDSATAQLFESARFQNKKSAKGYFF